MSKQPLVLLPGTLCDELLWEHQQINLSDEADVRIISLSKGSSISEMAASVLESSPPKFALAGLSLGGIVAMEIMRQSPERVMKLALISTNPYSAKPEQISLWEEYMLMACNGEFMDITERHLLPKLIYANKLLDNELVRKIKIMALNTGKTVFLNQAKAVIGRQDSRLFLGKIKCGTLVMVGREDAICSLEVHKEMASLIPNAYLVVIGHCGHLCTLEQPHEVTEALRYWLRNS